MESTHSGGGQPDALTEGRRIYIGNLLYTVQPQEIEQVLADQGFGDFAQIHISVDPVSGRNPGYCFVDFRERATAENALASLKGTIRDRPLKVGPCQPKNRRANGSTPWNRAREGGDRPAYFQRWGDWKRPDAGGGESAAGESAANARSDEKPVRGPNDALNHFNRVFDQQKGTRLYIGGLGQVESHEHNYEEMADLLTGFNPVAIGKRVTASNNATKHQSHRNYCFVDFETKEEATKVVNALDGKQHDGMRLIVSFAGGHPDRRKREESNPKQESVSRPRAMDSSDWRRRDN